MSSSNRLRSPWVWVWEYLAIFQSEDQRHLIPRNLLVRHLGGNPALGGVGLPCAGADVVDVSHGGQLQASSPAWSMSSKWRCGISGSKAAPCKEGRGGGWSTLSSRYKCGRWLCCREATAAARRRGQQWMALQVTGLTASPGVRRTNGVVGNMRTPAST